MMKYELMCFSSSSVEPASTKQNNCLNAAKACNLNDTCKKYRSSYITPCTSRVSVSEVCNKRKCQKALRQFFDKVIRHVISQRYVLLLCAFDVAAKINIKTTCLCFSLKPLNTIALKKSQ